MLINTFPMITSASISRMGIETSGISYAYIENGKTWPLEIKLVNEDLNEIDLTDSRSIWNMAENDLILSCTFVVKNRKFLYGPNGVVPRNGAIALGLQWTSRESRQRGGIPGGILPEEEELTEINIQYVFPAGSLRGSLSVLPVFYLPRSAAPLPEERHLAWQAGTILGSLEGLRQTVLFEGTRSIFPIYEIDDQEGDLWKVVCSWDNPAEDLFEDSFSIQLNRKHPRYKYLDRNSKSFDSQLLSEIISRALFILVEQVRSDAQDWSNIENGRDFAEGSVSQAINYFYQTLGWDWSSPYVLERSIRQYLNRGEEHES